MGSTWEYRVVGSVDEEALVLLGREGWELVAVAGGGEGEQAATTCYLKRPVASFRERVTLDQRRAYFDRFGDADAAGGGGR